MTIDGIFGSEVIDSSGEILDVDGADISSLEAGDGTLNWEHENGDTARGQESVGRIISVKKIFRESDCENARQREFWKKVKHPFIYGISRLYDGAGHAGALAIAAQIRDHHANHEPILIRFSVEGSTLERDGNILKRTAVRKVALTLKPANKTAASGLLEDPNAPKGFDKKPIQKVGDVLADLAEKNEHSLFRRLGGTVETEYQDFGEKDHSDLVKSLMALKVFKRLKKAMAAGMPSGAPSTLSGGAALQREDVKKKVYSVMKSFLDKNWDFTKEEARAALKAELPEASDDFLDHFAGIADDYRLKLRKAEAGDLPKANPSMPTEPRVDRESEPKGAMKPSTRGGVEMKPGGKLLMTAPGAGRGATRVGIKQHYPDDKVYRALLRPDEGLQDGTINEEQYNNIIRTVHEPWQRAMSNWMPLNKALSEGKVPNGIIAKSVIFAAMSPNCLDDKTEALTQRGWVKGFDLKKNDVLLTKNPVTMALEWQSMLDLRRFPDYEGDLVEIDSRSLKVVTTPDHRWLVTTQRGHVAEKTSATLAHAERIHRSGDYVAPENSSLTPDEAELLGWFVTDGFIRKPSPSDTTKRLRAFLVQSPSGNPAKCARIQALLERLAPGEFGRYQYNENKCNWYVGKRLTDLLTALCPDRTLTVPVLLTLGAEALVRLRDAMFLGDGSTETHEGQADRQVLATGREEQAGAFQALLLMTGNPSNAVNRDMSKYEPKSEKLKNIPKMTTCWYVSKLGRQNYRVNKDHIRRYRAKTRVWCPIVENTFFVARRLGQVFVTGNTPVSLQELYYGHYMDMMHEGQVDPMQPISEDALQEFQARATGGEVPKWNREHYETSAFKQPDTGAGMGPGERDVGELPQVRGLRNAHLLFPYLEHLTATHKDDTQGIAAELMDLKAEAFRAKGANRVASRAGREAGATVPEHGGFSGYGPKLTRYLLAMYGGGNMIVPDRHMIRSTFDLQLEPDPNRPHKFRGEPMLEKLQTQVMSKPQNEKLLRAIDHNFFTRHPAVKHVLETFPKHFRGREQQSVFPAFWLHWLTVGHYDQMRGRPSMTFNGDTDHRVFWDSVKDEMIKHGLHPHPIHNQHVPEDDSFDFGKSEDPWPRHQNHLDTPVWVKAAGAVEALRQRWGETPALMAFFSHILPIMNKAEVPVPPVVSAPHPAYNPILAKTQALVIGLRKSIADDRLATAGLREIAPYIHHAYVYRPGPDLKIRRHSAGRFTTAGNHVHILEDYHGDLGRHLTEGPLDEVRQQQAQDLKDSPRHEVYSLHELAHYPDTGLWPMPSAPIPVRRGFSIQHPNQDGHDFLEFRAGNPHLNGQALDDSQAQQLLHQVKNGHARIRHLEKQEAVVRDMEFVLETLLKADPGDPQAAQSVHEALGRLDQLVAQGHLDPKHAEALRAHAFKDPMTGHVMGNKFAHTDFKTRAESKGGIHVALDANDFKAVNDRFGHETGDRAIRAMGGALRAAVDEAAPKEGKLFRVGGDEFVAHFPTHEHAARFARTLRQHLEAVPPVAGVHKLSMGLGFGTSPQIADQALYEAKKQKYDPAGMVGLDSRKWISKFQPGKAPSMAHSLVPGFEGPIPLESSQLPLKPPPAPEPRPPAPEPVVHTPSASAPAMGSVAPMETVKS
jgi:diguanylate cyclase (GGDEF)-like protein